MRPISKLIIGAIMLALIGCTQAKEIYRHMPWEAPSNWKNIQFSGVPIIFNVPPNTTLKDGMISATANGVDGKEHSFKFEIYKSVQSTESLSDYKKELDSTLIKLNPYEIMKDYKIDIPENNRDCANTNDQSLIFENNGILITSWNPGCIEGNTQFIINFDGEMYHLKLIGDAFAPTTFEKILFNVTH